MRARSIDGEGNFLNHEVIAYEDEIRHRMLISNFNRNVSTVLHLCIAKFAVIRAESMASAASSLLLARALANDLAGVTAALRTPGVDANFSDEDLNTPLHHAATAGESFAVRRPKKSRVHRNRCSRGPALSLSSLLLVLRSSSSSSVERVSVTLLCAGNAAMVRELLKAGADVCARTREHHTPLAIALIKRHDEVVVALLERSAAKSVFITGWHDSSMICTLPKDLAVPAAAALMNKVDAALASSIGSLPATPPASNPPSVTAVFDHFPAPPGAASAARPAAAPAPASGTGSSSGGGSGTGVLDSIMSLFSSATAAAGAAGAAGGGATSAATAAAQLGHLGEWRGDERPIWCSLASQRDGALCNHGPIIQSLHWR